MGLKSSTGHNYWSLSGFYFLYFAFIGLIAPYFNLYLDAIGFDAMQIGLLSSLMLLTRIFAPSLWGYIADRSGRRVDVIRLGCLLALISFAGILGRQDFAWVAVVVTLHTVFWNAVLPQFEVLTLTTLGAQASLYGRVRLWGSLGFIAAVMVGGVLLDQISILSLPWLLLAILAATLFGTLKIREPVPAQSHKDRGSLGAVLRRPLVRSFFVCCFLMLLSHGPYYTFFSLFLQDHGYSRTQIGLLWSLGAVAEIGLFMVAHRLLIHFGVRQVLLVSLALASLRWLLTAFCVDSLPILLLAQLLHAATFGSFHAAGILLIANCFGQGHQGQGQALFSAVSFGAGGALGAWLSGLAWQDYPIACFVCASVSAALAWVIGLIWIRGPETGRVSYGLS